MSLLDGGYPVEQPHSTTAGMLLVSPSRSVKVYFLPIVGTHLAGFERVGIMQLLGDLQCIVVGGNGMVNWYIYMYTGIPWM